MMTIFEGRKYLIFNSTPNCVSIPLSFFSCLVSSNNARLPDNEDVSQELRKFLV